MNTTPQPLKRATSGASQRRAGFALPHWLIALLVVTLAWPFASTAIETEAKPVGITCGGMQSGSYSPNQTMGPAHSFTALRDQTVTARLTTTGPLEIYIGDANRKAISPYSNSSTSATIPADGTYYIIVVNSQIGAAPAADVAFATRLTSDAASIDTDVSTSEELATTNPNTLAGDRTREAIAENTIYTDDSAPHQGENASARATPTRQIASAAQKATPTPTRPTRSLPGTSSQATPYDAATRDTLNSPTATRTRQATATSTQASRAAITSTPTRTPNTTWNYTVSLACTRAQPNNPTSTPTRTPQGGGTGGHGGATPTATPTSMKVGTAPPGQKMSNALPGPCDVHDWDYTPRYPMSWNVITVNASQRIRVRVVDSQSGKTVASGWSGQRIRFPAYSWGPYILKMGGCNVTAPSHTANTKAPGDGSLIPEGSEDYGSVLTLPMRDVNYDFTVDTIAQINQVTFELPVVPQVGVQPPPPPPAPGNPSPPPFIAQGPPPPPPVTVEYQRIDRGVISPNQTMPGEVTTLATADIWIVNGRADDFVWITLSPDDSLVATLYYEDNSVLRNGSQIDMRLPNDGRYWINVSSIAENPGTKLKYEITLADRPPDGAETTTPALPPANAVTPAPLAAAATGLTIDRGDGGIYKPGETVQVSYSAPPTSTITLMMYQRVATRTIETPLALTQSTGHTGLYELSAGPDEGIYRLRFDVTATDLTTSTFEAWFHVFK